MAKTRKEYEEEISRLKRELSEARRLLKERSDTTSTTAAMSEEELKQALKGQSAQDLLIRVAMDHRILLQNQEQQLKDNSQSIQIQNQAAQLLQTLIDLQ